MGTRSFIKEAIFDLTYREVFEQNQTKSFQSLRR